VLEKDYVKSGRLRYAVRDFPLEAIHPQAFKAAEAARCAGDQGKYWEMHVLLFQNQRALAVADLAKHAATLGLDGAKFQACLDSATHAEGVRRDLAEGAKAGIRGTPTFFLGLIENGDRVRVTRVIRGAQPAAVFKAAIDEALAAK
jgi:protein-disulfide isomerase